MPAKIARLATRPPFWIPEVSVAVRSSRPSCSKAEKREYSWQIGSHPGNPGERLFLESNTLTPLLKRLQTLGYIKQTR
jgi:hypothetical protein